MSQTPCRRLVRTICGPASSASKPCSLGTEAVQEDVGDLAAVRVRVGKACCYTREELATERIDQQHAHERALRPARVVHAQAAQLGLSREVALQESEHNHRSALGEV